MKRITTAILALVGSITLALVQPAASTTPGGLTFLPTDARTLLLQKGEIDNTASRVQDLKWVAAKPWAASIASAWKGRETTFAAEMITLIDLPARTEPPQARLLRTFNTLNAVSTMKGTPYWSVTRQKWETLILESYRVASPQKKQRLPDLKFRTVPKSSALTVFQKDNRSGDGYSQITYTTQPSGFFITMRNLTGVNYGVVPLVKPGDLQTTFAIAFLQDKAVIYTVMGAKTISLAGLERTKDESFKNRMKALSGWFAKRL